MQQISKETFKKAQALQSELSDIENLVREDCNRYCEIFAFWFDSIVSYNYREDSLSVEYSVEDEFYTEIIQVPYEYLLCDDKKAWLDAKEEEDRKKKEERAIEAKKALEDKKEQDLKELKRLQELYKDLP